MTNQKIVAETDTEIIDKIFKAHEENKINIRLTSSKERKKKLSKLLDTIYKYRSAIHQALYDDYKKPMSEVDLTEIYPVVKEIKFARKNVSNWMADKKVATPLALFGSTSFVRYESKGSTLILAPWNFPINLTLCPLVSAVAAGNTAIIKPSEFTPNASNIIRTIVEEVFDENEVAVIEGGAETSKYLTHLPFNHIFFTGSPQVGRLVMKAASTNLTSVTLELGGKSPTIIDETADIDTAAKRTCWAKFMNNGQICVAPDYILIHSSKKRAFIESAKKYIKEFYSDAKESNSYSRIVNDEQHSRLKDYLSDAVDKGANIEIGGKASDESNYVSPTILTDTDYHMEVMENEIFGPILPVRTFNTLEEVVKEINSNEIPLAMYIYSKKKKNIDYIIDRTTAGGTCINHSGVHFYNPNLPFGGSNNSGIGKSHGYYGFESFSHRRAVLKQNVPNALELLVPPFDDFKRKLIELTIKYF